MATSVAATGTYAIVSQFDCTEGLLVLDVSDPGHPRRVGHYDTQGYAYHVGATDKRVFVSAFIGGLQIVELSELLAFTLFERNGADFLLEWPEAKVGSLLQRSDEAMQGIWQDIPESTATNRMALPRGVGSEFFQLTQPAW
jgi:hypothetical protein